MADYTVNYQILVDSSAAMTAINQFQQGVRTLGAMMSNFKTIETEIGKLNGAFASLEGKAPKLNVDISQAKTKTSELLGELKTLQNACKLKIVLDTGSTRRSGSTTLANVQQKMKSVKAAIDDKLADARRSIANFNKSTISPVAEVSGAQTQLTELLETLMAIQARSKIKITATATATAPTVKPMPATSSGGGTAAAAGGAAAATARRATSSRGQSSAMMSKMLYPTTQRVLGPTYANTGSNIMGEMVKGMGVAYGLSAIMSGIGTVFSDAANYQNISQTTRNILATHDSRMDFDQRFVNANKIMRKVGVQTRYTAPEVADAGKFLAMAGYNIDDISHAIKPISDIALVGDTDLGGTADVITNIMTSYELMPSRMDNAADILTMTFTKTNTTLMELAESFKYAGTIAHQTGLSFEETSAAFGILGNAGIKGSQAGTTLRMMLLNMLNPTKKQKAAWKEAGVQIDNGHGEFRSITDILLDLHKVSERMDAYDFTSLIGRMFRVTAAPGALALINDAAGVAEVKNANERAMGIAGDLATAKKNTVQGMWYQFTSSFTEAGMQGFESMQSGIRGFLQEMIDTMQSDAFQQALKSAMAVVSELAKGLLSVVQMFTSLWNAIPDGLKSALVSFAKFQMMLNAGLATLQMFRSTWIAVKGIVMGQWIGKSVGKIVFNFARIYQSIVKTKSVFGGLSLLMRRWRLDFVATSGAAAVASESMSGIPMRNRGKAKLVSQGNKMRSWSLYSVGEWGIPKMLSLPGIIASGAIAAGVYLASQAIIYKKAVNQMVADTERWKESYKSFFTNELDPLDENTPWLAAWRVMNNEAQTHQEKLETILGLYDQIYHKKGEEEKPVDDSTPFSESKNPGAALFKSMHDVSSNLWFSEDDKFFKYAKDVGASFGINQWGKPYMAIGDQSYDLSFSKNGPQFKDQNGNLRSIGIPRLARNAITHAVAAFNMNNPISREFERQASIRAFTAGTSKDIDNIVQGVEQRMAEIRASVVPNMSIWSDSRIAEETASEVYQHPAAASVLLSRAENQLKMLKIWQNIVDEVNKGIFVPGDNIQKILSYRVNPLIFDLSKGTFGSPDWIKSVRNMLANNDLTDKEDVAMISDTWKNLLALYKLLPKNLQFLLYPYLNRTAFQALIPGYSFGDGGYIGAKENDEFTDKDKQTYYYGPVRNKNNVIDKTSPFAWINKKDNSLAVLGPNGELGWGGKIDINNPLLQQQLENADSNSSNNSGGTNNGLGDYTDRYSGVSSSPKQVIVRIENLMNVESVDLSDERKAAAVNEVQQTLANVLTQVVADFAHNTVL